MDGYGLRLALTVLAGILVGSDRSERVVKAAGMRTTLLVCLAASVAMLQVNLLLPMSSQPLNSFVMNDLMRLPLGILIGVGFIGGGAILRRDDMVVGVTTAATLWLVTVIGLCLGGGQLVLGAAATLLGLFALWILKMEKKVNLRREQPARFAIEVDANGPTEREFGAGFETATCRFGKAFAPLTQLPGHRRLIFRVQEIRQRSDTTTPSVIGELSREPGVVKVEWRGGI